MFTLPCGIGATKPAGGGGGGSTTFQYWRIVVTANDGDGSFVSLAELQFYESADGTGTNLALAGTASQTGNGAVGPASRSNDDNDNSECGSSLPLPYTLTNNLGATYTLGSVGIISQRSVTGRTPTTFDIEGSADGSAWSPVASVSGSTGWGIKERRVFAL